MLNLKFWQKNNEENEINNDHNINIVIYENTLVKSLSEYYFNFIGFISFFKHKYKNFNYDKNKENYDNEIINWLFFF